METLAYEISTRLEKAEFEVVVLTFTLRNLPKEEAFNGARVIRIDVSDLPKLRLPTEAEVIFGLLADRALIHSSEIGKLLSLVTQFFSFHRRYVPRAAVFLQREILQIVRRERPDLIHVFSSRTAVNIFPVTRFVRSPIVVTYPGTNWTRSRVDRVFDKLCYSLDYDWYLMHEDGTGAERVARKMGVERVSSFLAGVDTHLFDPFGVSIEKSRIAFNLQEKTFVIGMIGRIEDFKGVREVVSAFLESAREDEILLLVGEANNRRYYAELVEILSLHPRREQVRFIGPLPHRRVPTFLAACDVLVFNSRYSNFNFALAETLLMGRPCLVKSAGMDAIRNELSACPDIWLYDNSDASLIGALKETRRLKGTRNFSKDEHYIAKSVFGWDKTINTIESAYAKALLAYSRADS